MKIPEHLKRDKYWRSLLYLFVNNYTLQFYLNENYFDLEGGVIKVTALKKVSKPWSQSEKFMLHLALHLFSQSMAKVNLSDMEYLDSKNKALVHEALKIRFG
ncbi:hypothetical protein [Paenibacillus sp. 1A_MP2]|uniref:hypothetical protein n=1 Tax=Paenibacillus sp. 1A_MP2 TaxID=3457495 RepID=UPI003FCCE479